MKGTVLLGKPIDNSQVVRQVDPRANRDIWSLLLVVLVLVGGLVLYAWPALQIRNTGLTAVQLSAERDRLVEANRKLRLQKAALENLERVEVIAEQRLGLETPSPERTVVVEAPRPAAPEPQMASHRSAGPPRDEVN